MKGKIQALLLAVSIFTGVSASAAELTLSENTVKVSAEAKPGETKILMVVKAGADISDNINIYAVKESTADEEGILTFTFNMSDERNGVSTNGEYDLFIRKDGTLENIGPLFYSTPLSRSTLTGSLADATDAAGVGSVLDNTDNLVILKSMDFNMDAYRELAEEDRTDVAKMIFDYTKDAESEKEFVNALGLAVAAKNISTGGEVSQQLEDADMEFEDVKYAEITDDKLTDFIDAYIEKGTYTSVTALTDAYAEANILYIINSTRYDYMENTLEKYAEALNIKSSSEYEEYLDLKSSVRTKANENLVSKLKSSKATTVSDLKSKLEAAVSAAKGSGSGGGGSSSGGSSFASGAASAIPAGGTVVPSDTTAAFIDLAEAPWAAEAISKMAKKGIISGDGNGKCRPNDTMKREEFVKMLVSALGIYDADAECDFEDVDKDAWYYRYVASAYNSGMIFGKSDAEFGIGSQLTRQDMAVISCRAAGGMNIISKVRETVEFTDSADISEYAKESVDTLYCAGVISGMDENTFSPMGTATRAQGVLVIYKLFFK